MLEVIDKGQTSERIRSRCSSCMERGTAPGAGVDISLISLATQGFRVLAPSTAGLHHEPITP